MKSDLLSKEELSEIISNYSNYTIKYYSCIDTSRDNNDLRQTYIVVLNNEHKIVIKATKNSFTNMDRIKGWTGLIEYYNSFGIYCPQIIQLKSNTGYSMEYKTKNNMDVVIYAEEYKKYQTFEEYKTKAIQEADNKQKIRKQIESLYNSFRLHAIETIGIIASNKDNANLPSWVSAYCLYDTFEHADKTDENFENVSAFYSKSMSYNRVNKKMLSKIRMTFLERKNVFENEYRKLPVAAFQSDLNPSNLLIDENLNFAGLIDFNLSGKETILNYVMRECMIGVNSDDTILDASFEKRQFNHLNRMLHAVQRHYSFSKAEKDACNTYLNLIYPFRFCILDNMIKHIEKGDYIYFNESLNWINSNLTREDFLDYIDL